MRRRRLRDAVVLITGASSGVGRATALAFAAVSAPVAAQMPPPSMEEAVRSAQPYLFKAGEGDVFEITSSQIALMRSRNPQVRAFATMLIDHHSRTTNSALAAAKAAGVMPPPPVLTPENRIRIDALYAAPAADFDRTYISQQVPSHQSALALNSGYASGGDMPQLRANAKAAVPIITSHLARARAMQAGM